jgi:hypothetical protein
MGSSYHPLPWNELTYDTSLGGYVVNRTKEQLEGAPAYSASELQSWDDAVYSGRVDDYYNAGKQCSMRNRRAHSLHRCARGGS